MQTYYTDGSGGFLFGEPPAGTAEMNYEQWANRMIQYYFPTPMTMAQIVAVKPNTTVNLVQACRNMINVVVQGRRIPASPTTMDKMNTCPRQFNASYIGKGIDKVPYIQSHYAVRGDILHKACENYLHELRRNNAPMRLAVVAQHAHEEMVQKNRTQGHTFTDEQLHIDQAAYDWLQPKLDALHKRFGMAALIEQKMAFNTVSFGTVWQQRDYGFKADFTADMNDAVQVYIDFKTGKVRPKQLQMEGTAFVSFENKPKLNNFIGEYWFADYQKTHRFILLRHLPLTLHEQDDGLFTVLPMDFPTYARDYWEQQRNGHVLDPEHAYPPKPNFLCGDWCDVLQCEHNGSA